MPARLRALLALDLRSLALLRIGVGALLLVDLAVRAGDLRAHYTDFGLLPRAELGLYSWRTVWNLHGLVSPWPAAVAALFALAALLAVALLLGWRTRAASFGSWLLLTSLQYRNPALVFGGDVMLRMLLFWGLFLPLGARWSLDARQGADGAAQRAEGERSPSGRHAHQDRPNAYASLATAALIGQLALVYVFSVLNRTGPTWWDGRALHDALHFDQFATHWGALLRAYESALPAMTTIAIWFEGLGPLLLLSPIATAAARTLAVALFVGFHACLALLFHIGLFPAVFTVAWIGMLPTAFWYRVLGARGDSGPPRWSWRAPRDAAVATAMGLVLLSNLASLRHDPLAPRATNAWERPAEWISVDQLWGLFSPDPPVYDGWYVFMGVQADGREVDPFWHGAVSFVKPPVVSETMNIRWREFFFRLQRDKRDPRWASFGRWLCRSWNETHTGPEALRRVYAYYVEETTNRPATKVDGTLTVMAMDCP